MGILSGSSLRSKVVLSLSVLSYRYHFEYVGEDRLRDNSIAQAALDRNMVPYELGDKEQFCGALAISSVVNQASFT